MSPMSRIMCRARRTQVCSSICAAWCWAGWVEGLDWLGEDLGGIVRDGDNVGWEGKGWRETTY
jgi:hypothetical protein